MLGQDLECKIFSYFKMHTHEVIKMISVIYAPPFPCLV